MSSIADRLESLREENTQLQQRIDQAEEGLNNTKTEAQAIMLRTHVEQYRTKLNKNEQEMRQLRKENAKSTILALSICVLLVLVLHILGIFDLRSIFLSSSGDTVYTGFKESTAQIPPVNNRDEL